MIYLSYMLLFKKATSALVGGAVAFLMSIFLRGLYDTDYGNDDADNRYYNTYNADGCF